MPIAATVSGAGDNSGKGKGLHGRVILILSVFVVWSNLAGTLGQGPDSRQAEQTCNGLFGVPLFM